MELLLKIYLKHYYGMSLKEQLFFAGVEIGAFVVLILILSRIDIRRLTRKQLILTIIAIEVVYLLLTRLLYNYLFQWTY